MTKRESKESRKEQSARFQKAVQDMIDAGELSPTEADERFDQAMIRLLPQNENDPPSQKPK